LEAEVAETATRRARTTVGLLVFFSGETVPEQRAVLAV
jgi:hypothetical protein